jgi:predicted nucleic acid-binding protein
VLPAPAVLDTDTLSEISRGHRRAVSRATDYLRTFGRFTITSVTVFERLRGYRLALREGKPYERQLEAFQALVASCVVLPFDDLAAELAARIWAGVTRGARHAQLGDILIAAIASSRQLPLITRNRDDFERLRSAAAIDLPLLDWTRR